MGPSAGIKTDTAARLRASRGSIKHDCIVPPGRFPKAKQNTTVSKPRPLRPLLIVGTRPEAIKMAPVILRCRSDEDVDPVLCSTGQHRQMLDQVLSYFDITPEIELSLMTDNQTLAGLTAAAIVAIDRVIADHRVDCVVVQGDTSTVMAGAMAAFFRRVPVVHVEAGLRTGDLNAPWPEEFNRRVAGIVASLHCAPTQTAADALAAEDVPAGQIQVTGNTVIDALLHTVARERTRGDHWRGQFTMLRNASPMVLITGHRRENWGDAMRDFCGAISTLASAHPDVDFVYPVHLNPNVHDVVHRNLAGRRNVHLLPPADYPGFVWLMDRAAVVLTDSGGVQEEAPSLGCRVIVTREKTERPEAVRLGLVDLVGTDRDKIVGAVDNALKQHRGRHRSDPAQRPANPYGDGHAADRIVRWMRDKIPRPIS